jgi:hypothetical protein
MKKIMQLFLLIFVFCSCGSYAGHNGNDKAPVSKEKAVEIASDVWMKTYNYSENDLNRYKPYDVKLVDGVWKIRGAGTWPEGTVGGAPYIEINESDGRVIKAIHYK